MSDERRRRDRTPFEGWVELTVAGERRLATGRDLSSSGIGVGLAGASLPPATPVTCEFALPGISLPLALDGRVIWAAGTRIGVAFDAIDPGLEELLENHAAGRL